MEMFIEEKGNIIIVHLSGTLSYDSIKKFDDLVEEQVRKKPEMIALNCIDLDHVDSYGIHHLFKFWKSASNDDIKLIAYDVSPSVMEIMKVTNLNTLMEVLTGKDFIMDYLDLEE